MSARHIILGPKTQRAKNILRQHGHMWTVEDENGLTLTLRSEKKTFIGSGKVMEHDRRWIYKKDDLNFLVISDTNGK